MEEIGFLRRHQRRIRKIGARSSNPRRCGKPLSSPACQPRTVLKRTDYDFKPMATSASSIPTRGRKRFLFDLRNASQTAEQGVEVHGFRILSAPLYLVLFAFIPAAAETLTLIGVVSGDEDGSFDCAIAHVDGGLIASLTVLVSGRSHNPGCLSACFTPLYPLDRRL